MVADKAREGEPEFGEACEPNTRHSGEACEPNTRHGGLHSPKNG
jgi:hypothetical protein